MRDRAWVGVAAVCGRLNVPRRCVLFYVPYQQAPELALSQPRERTWPPNGARSILRPVLCVSFLFVVVPRDGSRAGGGLLPPGARAQLGAEHRVPSSALCFSLSAAACVIGWSLPFTRCTTLPRRLQRTAADGRHTRRPSSPHHNTPTPTQSPQRARIESLSFSLRVAVPAAGRGAAVLVRFHDLLWVEASLFDVSPVAVSELSASTATAKRRQQA